MSKKLWPGLSGPRAFPETIPPVKGKFYTTTNHEKYPYESIKKNENQTKKKVPWIKAPAVNGMQDKKNSCLTEKYQKELFFPSQMAIFDLYMDYNHNCVYGAYNGS